MNKNRDGIILRNLALRWKELAQMPVMEERKRQWRALKDLRAERPMILVEAIDTFSLIIEDELQCMDPYLRQIEKHMRYTIKHAEEVGDDFVVEPFIYTGWRVVASDYGVPVKVIRNTKVKSMAFLYDHPIKTPEDVQLLKPRTFHVDRETSMRNKERLEELIGDILPVVMNFSGTDGYMHVGLTSPLNSIIGMESMMYWMHDAPQALHEVMRYLCDDRKAYIRFLEDEGVLGLNSSNNKSGSGSYGYISSLPANDFCGRVRSKDLWCFAESQETLYISPDSFNEYVLPYMAEVCSLYGYVYYGCCEPLNDRWDLIQKEIPNIRAVSISPWSNQDEMAAKLGKNYVYSRKPMSAYISGSNPDWDSLKNDAAETLKAARDINLEFVFRDIYDINGESERFAKWVSMVRSML